MGEHGVTSAPPKREAGNAFCLSHKLTPGAVSSPAALRPFPQGAVSPGTNSASPDAPTPTQEAALSTRKENPDISLPSCHPFQRKVPGNTGDFVQAAEAIHYHSTHTMTMTVFPPQFLF